MKAIFLLVLFTIGLYAAEAQNWQEWTSQKQTQIKYLLQQIAALHVYAESTLKGYKIVKRGLTTIQNIKDGDFHLHLDHINTLKQVNPAVQGYAKVRIIRSMQKAMVKQYTNTISCLKQNKELGKSDLEYYQLVCNKLLQQGIENLNFLTQLTSNNYFEMADDERIRRIDDLYNDMKDKRAFLQSFSNQTRGFAIQRLREAGEIKTIQRLYVIK